MAAASSPLIAAAVVTGGLAAALLYCLALLGAGVLALAATGSGRRRCAAWSLSGYLGVALALGSGIVASFWIVLAVLDWLLPAAILGALAATLAAAFPLLRPLAGELRQRLRETVAALASDAWMWRAVAVLTGLTIAAFAVTSFHPPRGDSVAFYLPWPRIIAHSGRMLPLPGYEAFSDIWTIAEIHTAAVMATLGDWATRPLAFLHAAVAALLVWGIGRDLGLGPRGRLIAVAMLFTSSAVGLLVWDGKTDLVALPIGLAAMYGAMHLSPRWRWPGAVATGLLCGFAVAAKLSYLPVLALAVLVLAGFALAGQGAGRSVRNLAAGLAVLAVIGLAASVAVAPQIAKNWSMSGEPLAPFLYFSGQGIDTEQSWYTAGTTARLLLTYPLALTFGSYWAQHGNLSLLLLALLPLALLRAGGGASPALRLLTGAALAGLLAWMVTRPSTFAPRYILCVLVVPFLYAADAAARATLHGPRGVRVLVPLFVIFVLGTTAWSLRPQIRTALAYAGTADIESYDADDTFTVARLLNASAEPGARIAMMNYYRYPLRPDLLECALGVPDLKRITAAGDAMMVGFFRQGADYLVYDLSTHTTAMSLDFSTLPAWLHTEEIYRGGRLRVFRIAGGPGSPPRETICREEGRGWVAAPATRSAAAK
jgi:hypothetical protein